MSLMLTFGTEIVSISLLGENEDILEAFSLPRS